MCSETVFLRAVFSGCLKAEFGKEAGNGIGDGLRLRVYFHVDAVASAAADE